MTALRAWVRALEYTKSASDKTLPGLINDLADTFQDRPALLNRSESVTYAGLAHRINQYARWAMAQGLGRGDVVCLLMTNQPDYVAIWLALTRIGCTVALLNTGLRGGCGTGTRSKATR
jgi:fatty-acyl-CoA synthase